MEMPSRCRFPTLPTVAPSNQVVCHFLHTTDAVHQLVRDSIDESPLFNGQIAGIGPRYCPSLEDKVMRFPHRDRHQLFLEPEGLDVEEIYVNGFSRRFPEGDFDETSGPLPVVDVCHGHAPIGQRAIGIERRCRPNQRSASDTQSDGCPSPLSKTSALARSLSSPRDARHPPQGSAPRPDGALR